MPQPVAFSTVAFSGDQRVSTQISYWDTPFLVLEGEGDRAASAGLIFETREPTGGTWALAAALQASGDPRATWNASRTGERKTVTNGRIGNVIEYWAGGAPGWHGISQRGRCALYYRGAVRPVGNRAWFSKANRITVTFLVGCNGYVRLMKNNTEVLLNEVFTEKDYLSVEGTGLRQVGAISLVEGDVIELYYVQRTEDSWGGVVLKALEGDLAAVPDRNVREQIMRDAPIVGCGFLDSGEEVPERRVRYQTRTEVTRAKARASDAEIDVPLINPQMNDGTGWEWRRDVLVRDDPGMLRYHEGNVEAKEFDLKRQRLIQVKMGVDVGEVWTVFTGSTDDFQGISDGTARIKCIGPEQRLLERFDKNFPDKIDYMSRNYRKRLGATQPVYEIPAFDNWPLEYAVAQIAYRAGVDASRMRRQLVVGQTSGKHMPVAYGGQPFLKFRARGMEGKLIRLERAANYGNYGQGFREAKAKDDEYIFKPNATRELWARMVEFSDRYGYDLRFDEHGDLVLATTNNPAWIYSFSTADGGGTRGVHPSAHGGIYIQATGGTFTKTVEGARVDLAVGRFSGAGSVNYTVTRVSDSVVVASGTVATASTREEYFYDYRAATDGVNSTVVTLWSGDFDTYTVAISPSGTVRLDSVLAYHTDPETPRLLNVLSTQRNAISVTATDSLAEMRNFVIVVGRRKANVTDSEKLETNPNNPEQEFVVAAAVDVRSISDPSALHYVGQIKETVIYSDGITDDDFASYLARVFIYRYRNPKAGATVEHTVLPFIQLRDPVYAAETRYASVSSLSPLYVESIRHVATDKYVTTLECKPWPEYPSYEPRTDIDIDANFGGRPVINVEVSYTSLDATAITNAATSGAWKPDDTGTDDVVTLENVPVSGGYLNIAGAWPPVPGTVFIRPVGQVGEQKVLTEVIVNAGLMPGGAATSAQPLLNYQAIETVTVKVVNRYGSTTYTGPITQDPASNPVGLYYEVLKDGETRNGRLSVKYKPPKALADPRINIWVSVTYRSGLSGSNAGWMTNNPYHRFFDIDYAGQRLHLVWQEGALGDAAYANPHTAFDVTYRRLRTSVYPSGCPLYDPYTSQLGYLVQVKADFLVSGLYRIAVRSLHDDKVVAYLTEPTNESADKDAHFTFFQAGKDKVFYWDGVDAVGSWNGAQSEDYATSAQGAFEQGQKPLIGKGFYAWNRERAGGEWGPQCIIDPSTTGNRPDWDAGCVGTYAGWYLTFEATNDELEAIAEQNLGKNPLLTNPRAVSTTKGSTGKGLDPQFQTNSVGSTEEAIIWTHLPRPSRVELEVHDWDGTTDFDDQNPADIDSPVQWVAATGDSLVADHVNNYKPVRVRFTMDPRPGTLWAGTNALEDSVRLFRVVHLKSVHHDQYIVFNGVTYAGSTVEDRQVVTRRLHNDTNTFVFADATYRKAKTFKPADEQGVEWFFMPKYAQKNWTGTEEKPLTFGNPLELEDVPKWDNGRQVAGPRSRFNFGFLAYLWYLSLYTQDRSGRFSWAINPAFRDASKIVGNTTVPITWPDDPLRQHRRTILCRQWTNERAPGDRYTDWTTYQTEKWGLGAAAQALLQHEWRDHDPTSTTLGGAPWPTLGTDHYSTNEAGRNVSIWSGAANTREWHTGHVGAWSFETGPTWCPNVTRDWFPYHLIPPMMDHHEIRNRNDGRTGSKVVNAVNGHLYLSVDPSTGTASDASANANTGNDPGKGDVWSSAIWHQEESNTTRKKFWPGSRVTKEVDPVKSPGDNTITENMMDYTRQDDTTHYEEFRGIFSRGPRPGEGPRRSQPILPYFINQGRYNRIWTFKAANKNDAHPNHFVDWSSYFSIHFRHEYVWESASLFPTNAQGDEQLGYVNLEHARVFSNSGGGNVRYDGGAYIGWKDDYQGVGTALMWDYDKPTVSVFDSGFMPVGISRSVPHDRELLMHLTLVNERRDEPATDADDPESAVGPAASIAFAPTSLSAAVFTLNAVAITVRDAGGRQIDGAALAVAVDDPSIVTATLVNRGTAVSLLTLREGTTTVRVTVLGTAIAGTLAVTATATPTALAITEPPAPLVLGVPATLTATAPGYVISWSVDNPFIFVPGKFLTVSGEANTITPLRVGTAVLTLEAEGQRITRSISVIKV